MENKLYEFGGIADVLIKCKTARTIGGIEYAEGEPYTLLKEVAVQLNYEQHNATSNAKKPVMETRDGRPYELIIGGIPLNEKIVNLILSETNETYEYTKKEIITCWEDGSLQLSNEAINNCIFCYDENFNRIEAKAQDNLSVVYGDFVKNSSYLVFYTVSDIGEVYKFEIPHYAYFSIELFIKGNTNKITNDVYMAFDAASLVTVPNFNILSGGLLNTPLVFRLIYQYQKEPIVVFS